VIGADDGAPGFGVYLHWPFCAAKCPYCDFNSHVRQFPPDQQRFANAFATELSTMRERTGPRTVKSIFIGGGTPSLMDPNIVGQILEKVASLWSVPEGIEITMEANPSSVEATRFRGYRAAGVNRVSMGVQSLNDEQLKFLGRLHNVEEALKAIRLAREIFPRMSFDLIYARPDQKHDDWEQELNRAIDLAADHLSLYQLTIEDGTAFHKLHAAGKLKTLGDDRAADLYALTQQITAARGLPAYEISNHAQPGAESRHNLVYWRYGEYVGAGPGAHGRFKEFPAKVDTGFASGNSSKAGRSVTITERNPEQWLKRVEATGHGIVEEEFLNQSQQSDEFLLMGLRLVEGIDIPRFEQLSGRALNQRRVSTLRQEGMIEPVGNSRLRATPAGMIVLDAVVADLAME
jgi:putative oxygen-independent coproporphyrinogen III oxidase